MATGVRTPTYGTTKTAWVTTISSLSAPTAVEVIAGKELTNYELPDSSVKADASDTINEKAVGDIASSDTPTFANYSGSLHLFRSLAAGVPGTDDLLATFQGRPQGYYVRRIGPLATVAFTAADKVEVYKFIADSPSVDAPDGGMAKIMVPLLKQGYFKLDQALA